MCTCSQLVSNAGAANIMMKVFQATQISLSNRRPVHKPSWFTAISFFLSPTHPQPSSLDTQERSVTLHTVYSYAILAKLPLPDFTYLAGCYRGKIQLCVKGNHPRIYAFRLMLSLDGPPLAGPPQGPGASRRFINWLAEGDLGLTMS